MVSYREVEGISVNLWIPYHHLHPWTPSLSPKQGRGRGSETLHSTTLSDGCGMFHHHLEGYGGGRRWLRRGKVGGRVMEVNRPVGPAVHCKLYTVGLQKYDP